MIAVPFGVYKELPAEAMAGKPVVDTMNYYPQREGRIDVLDARRTTSSELVQEYLADFNVVKALHNLDFYHLLLNARPSDAVTRSSLPIAGNNADAKTKVTEFMNAIGYDAVDIGPLSESWRCEPRTPVYVWPYVDPPEGMSQEEAKSWFRESSGLWCPKSKCRNLWMRLTGMDLWVANSQTSLQGCVL